MSKTIEIDAIGKKCPRPIVEIAKAFRRSEKGDMITIKADDLAFESDVHAWCETTGNALVSLIKEESIYTAVIRIGE